MWGERAFGAQMEGRAGQGPERNPQPPEARGRRPGWWRYGRARGAAVGSCGVVLGGAFTVSLRPQVSSPARWWEWQAGGLRGPGRGRGQLSRQPQGLCQQGHLVGISPAACHHRWAGGKERGSESSGDRALKREQAVASQKEQAWGRQGGRSGKQLGSPRGDRLGHCGRVGVGDDRARVWPWVGATGSEEPARG